MKNKHQRTRQDMSNPDSFIEEVTEEVRRDRLFQMMRRYGWIAVALVLILVGGAAYIEWQRASDRAAAEATGDAILAALDKDDAAARRTALAEIDAQGARGAVISLLAVGESDGATDQAAAQLQALADDDEVPQIYRDMAVMKLVLLSDHQIAPADRMAMLEPLTAPGRAFRLLALEQIALAHVALGEADQAIAIANDVMVDGQVTQDLRRRLSQLIVALGGTLDDA